MGTGETGSGTRARHSCSASTGAGTTASGAAGSAVTFDSTNVALAADDCVRFDVAAQQASACTWVIPRFESDPRDSDLCIGQLVPLMQHAIRASGVACHPAQTARFPANSVAVAATAAMCLAKLTTYVGCWTAGHVSNARPRILAEACGRSRWFSR